MATWASQMSVVRVRPHSTPTDLASMSKEAITQCSNAFASCACADPPRHTCARAVLGTTTSAVARAASLSAAHSRRSLRSRAMRALESRTMPLISGVAAACARPPRSPLHPADRVPPPTLRRPATTLPHEACDEPHPRAMPIPAPCRWHGARRAQASDRRKWPTSRQSYGDIADCLRREQRSSLRPRTRQQRRAHTLLLLTAAAPSRYQAASFHLARPRKTPRSCG